MEKRYISQKFDKFKNRTDTSWSDPLSGKVFGAKWSTWFWELDSSSLGLGLRHVKSPEIDSLVIDYRYYSKDWMFIRNGGMIINVDGKNINLIPHESNTDVRDGGRIYEEGYFSLTKNDLTSVCKGESVSVRVSGKGVYFELKDKGLLKFRFMCRSFYADFYDDTNYNDWINSVVPPGTENKGSCYIATATLGDYDDPIVKDLRIFRDTWLVERKWGIRFKDFYYSHGPKAARIIKNSNLLKKISLLLLIKPLRFLIKKFSLGEFK